MLAHGLWLCRAEIFIDSWEYTELIGIGKEGGAAIAAMFHL